MIGLLLLSGIAFSAPAPAAKAPALEELVARLQVEPEDQELREQIFARVSRMKAPPPPPEEARRRMTRAEAFVETAQAPEDFKKVAVELEEALKLAPWWAKGYYNLGLAREKAREFDAARQAFENYLLAAPGAANAEAVRSRLVKLEVYEEQEAARAPDMLDPAAAGMPPYPWPPLDRSLDYRIEIASFSGKPQRQEHWHVGTEFFAGREAYAIELRQPDSPYADQVRSRTYYVETSSGLAMLGTRVVTRMVINGNGHWGDNSAVYDPPMLVLPREPRVGASWSGDVTVHHTLMSRSNGPSPMNHDNAFEQKLSPVPAEIIRQDGGRVGKDRYACWVIVGKNAGGEPHQGEACYAPGIGLLWSRDGQSEVRLEKFRLSRPAFGMGERQPPLSAKAP